MDPALIRAGRMDVKVEYKLATRRQISQTYLRFFERQFTSAIDHARPTIGAGPSRPQKIFPVLSDEEIQALSETFGDRIPEHTFSIAQVQGYLLTKKADAKGAVEHVTQWVQDQLDERQKIKDLKEKKKRRQEKRAQEKKEREKAELETNGNGFSGKKNGMNGELNGVNGNDKVGSPVSESGSADP